MQSRNEYAGSMDIIINYSESNTDLAAPRFYNINF